MLRVGRRAVGGPTDWKSCFVEDRSTNGSLHRTQSETAGMKIGSTATTEIYGTYGSMVLLRLTVGRS